MGPAFRRTDLLAAVLLGEGIAWLGLFTFSRLSLRLAQDVAPAQERIFLAVVLPVVAALGVRLAALLGRWVAWILQAAKFCLVGLFNTSLDFAVLNLVMAYLDATHGVSYSVCKAVSFSTAVVNSYAWNRLWTFGLGLGDEGADVGLRPPEFLRFLAVTLIGLGLNVSVATLLVSFVNPSSSLAAVRWANAAAGVALLASATWDFLAYRYIFGRPR